MNKFFRPTSFPQTSYTASTKNKLKDMPNYLEQENRGENI
jgi:hypothetical protein